MDKICITNLQFDTVIGVYAWEKTVKQTLSLDLELSCDLRKAAARDQLTDALDYTAIANRIIRFATEQHFQLLETLAEKLAQVLLMEFPVSQVKLQLSKRGAIPQADAVMVSLQRSKQ